MIPRIRLQHTLFTLLVIITVTVIKAGSAHAMKYRETTGTTYTYFTLKKKISGSSSLVTIDNGLEVITATGDDLWRTTSMVIEDKRGKSLLQAVRGGNQVTITQNGEVYQNQIDSAPWYSSMNDLEEFIGSGEGKHEFWVVGANFNDPNGEVKAKATKFVAINKGADRLEYLDQLTDVIKVVVTFADWRSLFWKSYYWYRTSDDVLIRSEQVRGGPGTPTTIVELLSE